MDKSLFVRDVLEASAHVLLIPRPRRFGKTLNISMLRAFLERSSRDASPLFRGLAIEHIESAQQHFQRYPAIALTFKDAKAPSWDLCFEAIRGTLARLFGEHRYLLDGGALREEEEEEAFRAVLFERASEPQCWRALADLSRHLSKFHQERVVLLIDEYDTPINAGFTGHYYDRAIAFFRNFLSGALKDNPVLFKGVLTGLTGVLRIAKESIFSGLNNLAVFSLLRPEFSSDFGFTENEVESLLRATGDEAALGGVRAWYDGYRFGERTIYNPWSVFNFLDSEDRMFRPYWVSTGSDDVLRDLLFSAGSGVRPEVEDLLSGNPIERQIEEDVVLRDLGGRPETVWSLLLFSGYLKPLEIIERPGGTTARLAVPNEEVRRALSALAGEWLRSRVGGSEDLEQLLCALLGGDAATVEQYLSRIVELTLSYHDTGRDAGRDAGRAEPERMFHGFIVGLLVSLADRWDVRSNRESGHGRYDVMLLPKKPGDPGVVMELKVLDRGRGDTEQTTLDSALAQVRARDYAAELRARGAAPIHEFAAVFEGKSVWVRCAAP